MKKYRGYMMIKTQKLKYLLIGAVLGGGMAALIFYPQIQILKSNK